MVKNSLFAFFQGYLAWTWPGNKATISFLTSPANTLQFGLHGVHLEFFCMNYANFFTFEFFWENCIECIENN